MQALFTFGKTVKCSITIDVTPLMYTKSDKYLKMLIENKHIYRKDLSLCQL